MTQHQDKTVWDSLPGEMRSFYKDKKVLITGGLGMIGSSLAQVLVPLGAEVSILDALLPLYGGNRFNLHGIEDRVDVTIGDIRDPAAVETLVRDKDVIFHLAAQVSYIDSLSEPLLDLDINCLGSLILLEACKKLNRKAKIVFTGSRMQYGRIAYNPVDEHHPTEPLMTYGIHKLAVEKYHLMYFQNYGMPTSVVRISNPYGPRQQMKHSKYGIINWFIKLAMTDQVIKVFGEGGQIRDYIYVDDVAGALLAVGCSPSADGEIFNVGSGRGVSFIHMIQEVIRIVQKGRIEMVPWPKDYQNVETGDFIANVGKIYGLLGWRAVVDLPDGIQKTVDYYRTHKQHYW
jgi:nucleoside-diphosphate-sugar epimerase